MILNARVKVSNSKPWRRGDFSKVKMKTRLVQQPLRLLQAYLGSTLDSIKVTYLMSLGVYLGR